MADQIEEVEVVKKDLYTPFIDRAEEQVAEMTYARADVYKRQVLASR